MAEYKIVEIRPFVDIAPDGRFIKKYRVTFKFDGREDYIDIPEEEYSEANVRKKVEERVKIHKSLLTK